MSAPIQPGVLSGTAGGESPHVPLSLSWDSAIGWAAPLRECYDSEHIDIQSGLRELAL
jgi:hypothetical protein